MIKDQTSIFKWGLLKALKTAIKDGLGNTCWNFCHKPIILFTLVEIALTWMSKDGPDLFRIGLTN